MLTAIEEINPVERGLFHLIGKKFATGLEIVPAITEMGTSPARNMAKEPPPGANPKRDFPRATALQPA